MVGTTKSPSFWGWTRTRWLRGVANCSVSRSNEKGSGNKEQDGSPRKKTPEVIDHIAGLLQHDKAGDPMCGLKWTRKATRNIARQLRKLDIDISANTVGRLLRDVGFSLRVNHKTLESGNKNPPPRRVRNRQFKYINTKRNEFASRQCPILSVDCKKNEMVGNFKTMGRRGNKNPIGSRTMTFVATR